MIAISMGLPTAMDAGSASSGKKDVIAGLFAESFEQAAGDVKGALGGAASAGSVAGSVKAGVKGALGSVIQQGADGSQLDLSSSGSAAMPKVLESASGLSLKAAAAAVSDLNSGGSAAMPKLLESASGLSLKASASSGGVRVNTKAGAGRSVDPASQQTATEGSLALTKSAAGASTKPAASVASNGEVSEGSDLEDTKSLVGAGVESAGAHSQVGSLVGVAADLGDEANSDSGQIHVPGSKLPVAPVKGWTSLETPKDTAKSSGKTRWQELSADGTDGKSVGGGVGAGASDAPAILDPSALVASTSLHLQGQQAIAQTATTPAVGSGISDKTVQGQNGSRTIGAARTQSAGVTSVANSGDVLPVNTHGNPIAEGSGGQAGGGAQESALTASAVAAIAAAGISASNLLTKAGKSGSVAKTGKSSGIDEKRQGQKASAGDGPDAAAVVVAHALPNHAVAGTHSATQFVRASTDQMAGAGSTSESGSGLSAVSAEGAIPVSTANLITPSSTLLHETGSKTTTAATDGGFAHAASAAGASAGVYATGSSEDGMFQAMGSKTVEATPTVLEIGVPGGSHGWLKIRAEVGEGGTVQASMSSATAGGQDALHRELPAMAAFLQSEHVPITLQVAHAAASGGATDGGGSGAGTAMGNGSASDQGSSAGSGSGWTGADATGTQSGSMTGGAGSGQPGGYQQGSAQGSVVDSAANIAPISSPDSAWTTTGRYNGEAGLGGGGWLNVMA